MGEAVPDVSLIPSQNFPQNISNYSLGAVEFMQKSCLNISKNIFTESENLH